MKSRLPALFLATLMATVSFSTLSSAETEGRQGADVDCSGYTFEDLFDYNYAIFDIIIDQNWATADIGANSWVNDSKAAIVRANIDSLFDGIPGGNNSWLSTDEREAVREVGPKCIADMFTRVGIREGLPHRGGVDWNDMEFVEEGIGLDEVNLVPEDHPDERTCQNALASTDCKEVPVSATNNLEISMFTKEDETHNAQFNKLANSGVSNFTIAYNATNVSAASITIILPAVDGLRMAAWTIEDDGVENLDPGMVSEDRRPDGSVAITLDITYDRALYPTIRNIFVDMTTMAPQTNDVPIWGANVPNDDTIIPMFTNGENVAVEGTSLEDWASDNDGWHLDCNFNEAGWSSRMSGEGDLMVSAGDSDSGTATCSLVDSNGEVNNVTRTWRFGQPAAFSAVAGTYSNSVDIDVSPTLLVQNLAVDLSAIQSGVYGPSSGVSLGSTTVSTTVSLSGLSPGEFQIHIMASSSGMLDWDVEIELALEKANTPPSVTVSTLIDGSHATWSADQYSFSLSGTAIDPDGGEISMSATLCGDTSTSFNRNVASWDVTLSIANCVAQGKTQYDVIISATDDVGAITSVDVNVPDPLQQEPAVVIKTPVDQGNGLPAIGALATLISLLGAAILVRRD